MSDSLKIGMVGCGGIAGAHREGYQILWEHGLRDFEIVAACDIEESRAAQMAEEISAFQGRRPQVYSQVEAMLDAEKELQAVDICAAHRAHHALAVPCLEAGKHVTIEKPLAITLRAGRMMLEAAEKAGALLQVAENYRRDPSQRAIRWAVQEGMIGKVRMYYWIDVGERLWHWGWREQKSEAGGGWSLDGGVHFADLFRFHVGPIRSLYADVRAFHPYRYEKPDILEGSIPVDVEDTTVAVFEFENGALGQWTSTSAAPGMDFHKRAIYGEQGALDLSDGLVLRGGESKRSLAELVDDYRSAIGSDAWEQLYPKGVTSSIATELWEFVQAVLHGSPLETDGWEGYRAEAVSMALYESARLKRPVTLAEVENLEAEGYQKELNEGLRIANG
ncbi:MAG: Gfo/Idh/MocA family oxidoreductase [Armatimonadetes bacterium]|nr:Gfo/Idh/MocA family oxidoreductase [Armatimonadota bacterium]